MRTAALVFLFALALVGILVRPEVPASADAPKQNGFCTQLVTPLANVEWSVDGPEGAAFFWRDGFTAPELCVIRAGIYNVTASRDGKRVGGVTITVEVKPNVQPPKSQTL